MSIISLTCAPASKTVNITGTLLSTHGFYPQTWLLEATPVGFSEIGAPTGGDIYDTRLHRPVYIWTDSVVTSPYSRPDGLWPEAARSHVKIGAKIVVTINDALSHTWTCRCEYVRRADGVTETGIGQVVLAAPLSPTSHFADSEIIYVDTTGTYAGVPAAAAKTTSLISAVGMLNGASGPRWIQVMGGQTHNLNSASSWSSAYASALISSAPGTGRATIAHQSGGVTDSMIPLGTFVTRANSYLILQDVDIIGPWNANTESPALDDFNSVVQLLSTASTTNFLMMIGCTVTGIGKTFFSGNQHAHHVVIEDTYITNWADYGAGLLIANGVWAIQGCLLAQRPDASGGGAKGAPITKNQHGPFRIRGAVTIVAKNQTCTLNGWVQNVTAFNGVHTEQAPRILSTHARGDYAHVSECIFEGGFEGFNATPDNGGITALAVNLIGENILTIGSHHTGYAFRTAFRCTWRNSVIAYPALTRLDAFLYNPQTVVQKPTGQATSAENNALPLEVYNCTIFNDSAIAFQTITGGGWTASLSANNLISEPNISPANDPHGPLNIATLFNSRHTRDYFDSNTASQAGTGTPIAFPTLARTPTGSTALGAATQRLLSRDLTLAVRPDPDNLGAYAQGI